MASPMTVDVEVKSDATSGPKAGTPTVAAMNGRREALVSLDPTPLCTGHDHEPLFLVPGDVVEWHFPSGLGAIATMVWVYQDPDHLDPSNPLSYPFKPGSFPVIVSANPTIIRGTTLETTDTGFSDANAQKYFKYSTQVGTSVVDPHIFYHDF